uniref:Uncharacterized protein n=1 Tax=Arundo donax TaxID=35708 RepID=A0A0A8Z4A2_ARUDO
MCEVALLVIFELSRSISHNLSLLHKHTSKSLM